MKKIKEYFDKLTMKVGMNIAKRMSPVIKEAIDNPKNLIFEGYIEGDEIIVRIRVKDEP